MKIRERLARAIYPQAFRLGVTATVDESRGWVGLAGTGPSDRAWPDVYLDMVDALEAWRKNFMVRRIVTLTRSYVVSGGIALSSKRRDVDAFLHRWWAHEQNHMDSRLGPMCDELTRNGEIFPTLHTNPIDGMSYVRFVPATQIVQIRTADNDYENELWYGEQVDFSVEPKWWPSDLASDAPPMLHMAVNRPIGATRGEGDLVPILKWALRYSTWLEDRVRLNRLRTRNGLLDVKITEDTQVEAKRSQLLKEDPMASGIYVHGSGEHIEFHALKIEADQAADDGKALRLAVATGANTGLHYFGEGAATNYATAKEMGEPTARFYSERQDDLCHFLIQLAGAAWRRYAQTTSRRAYDDLAITASAIEPARADNAGLATAAASIVGALATMKAQGWIDDATAITLAFKFAGETIGEEQIKKILSERKPEPEPPAPPAQQNDDSSNAPT